MTVDQILSRVPKFMLKRHEAFRFGNRVLIEKTLFLNTLAAAMDLDPMLFHDDGRHYVIFAATA